MLEDGADIRSELLGGIPTGRQNAPSDVRPLEVRLDLVQRESVELHLRPQVEQKIDRASTDTTDCWALAASVIRHHSHGTKRRIWP